jgi:hypothetical protein
MQPAGTKYKACFVLGNCCGQGHMRKFCVRLMLLAILGLYG